MLEPVISIDYNSIPLVLNGTKTSTIRKGRWQFYIGNAALVNSRHDQVIPIVIEEMVKCKYKALNHDDALIDGFNNLEELQAALRYHYPSIKDDDIITIIYFRKA